MTPREQQVLALIGRGYSIPQIAERLFRSQKTVETHRQSLGRKLGVNNRVELARIAIQTGLAPLDAGGGGFEPSTPRPDPALAADDPRRRLVGDAAAAEALYRIESACAASVGQDYCQRLTQWLADTLETSGAGVITLQPQPEDYVTLALRHRNAWSPTQRLPLGQGPCRRVIDQQFFTCIKKVPQRFPGWSFLREMPVHSYMGVRLDDPDSGELLGILLLLQDEPAGFNRICETVLRICAVRTAAELGRLRLIDSLQQSVEHLEQRLSRHR